MLCSLSLHFSRASLDMLIHDAVPKNGSLMRWLRCFHVSMCLIARSYSTAQKTCSASTGPHRNAPLLFAYPFPCPLFFTCAPPEDYIVPPLPPTKLLSTAGCSVCLHGNVLLLLLKINKIKIPNSDVFPFTLFSPTPRFCLISSRRT